MKMRKPGGKWKWRMRKRNAYSNGRSYSYFFSFLFFCAFLPGRLVIFSFLIITDYDYVVRRI